MGSILLSDLEQLLKRKIENLQKLCLELNKIDIVENLNKLLYRLENPFLITVFGEVKAGKSSLLNALLGIPDLCKVDIDICTDRIVILKYSEKPYEKEISDYIVEIGLPNELLKGFIVVDTPGINSVIEHHTEITEKFLPQSDVLLVVIPAYNPHTKYIWDWIKLISKDFGKKIVIVLQQKDRLLPEELKVNLKKTKEYAQMAGLERPVVFAVSAKAYFEGKPDNGITELKQYLEKHFTGEKQKIQKLKNLRFELIKFYEECLKHIRKLEEELENYKKKLQHSLEKLKINLQTVHSYQDLIGQSLENFLTHLENKIVTEIDKISLKNLIFNKDQVKLQFEKLAKDIADDIRNYLKNELAIKFEYFEIGILKPSMEEAVKNIEDLKQFLAKIATTKKNPPQVDGYKLTNVFVNEIELPRTQETLALIGGGVIAGSLLGLLTASTLMDITGGFIAALSVAAGSLYISTRKGKLKTKARKLFQEKIKKKLIWEIRKVLENRIEASIIALKKLIEDHLRIIDKQLEELKHKRELLERELSELKKISFEE